MNNLSGATTAVFIVSLSAALEMPVAVAWKTKDGTAKAGTDYEASGGSVTFEPGETAKQVQVVVYGRAEGDTETRTFGIELYPPENAILDQTLTEIDILVTDSEGTAITSVVVPTGPRGLKGDPGLSAYELAKLQGYTGTMEEWLQTQTAAGDAAERAEAAAAGIDEKIDLATNEAVSRASNEADRAQGARTGAEIARDAAEAKADNDFTFNSEAEGIAGTTNGQTFRVPQGVGAMSSFIYYRNNSGTATAIAWTLGKAAFDQLNSFFAMMNISTYRGTGPVYPYALDIGGKVLLGYDRDAEAIVGAGLLSSDKVNALIEMKLNTVLDQIGLAKYKGNGPVFPWFTDATGHKVLLGYDSDKKRVVGAIADASTGQVRAEKIPLPSNLKPIAKLMNIILGYGQSLSVGAQGIPVISTTQPYSNVTYISGPRGYNHDYSALAPLVEDNRASPDGGANRGETFCSGAANYASTLAAVENGVNPANHVIFASTAGKGGTKIADLVKGSAWYNSNFLPQVNGAYSLNNNSAVHAIPWAQGETDNDQSTPTPFAAYRAYLEQFQVDAEADIKAVNGQASPVHILTYQTSYKVKTSTGVALAQLDLATKNDKFHFVSPCYHLPFYTDGTHLTNVGYKWLGAYYGRAYKTLVHDQCYPQFLRPVSAVLRGNVVMLTLDAPVSPVVLDTTNLAVTTDNGFVVKGSTSGTALTIASMQTEGNQVKITLAATPAENVILRYALDYLGAGLNIVNGASGNLRDSDPSTINIQGVDRPLFHVCPHFEMNVIKVGE